MTTPPSHGPRRRQLASQHTVRCVLAPLLTPDGRERWYKLVRGIDVTARGGFAFLGEFMRPGVEVDIPVGGVLVAKEPTGLKRRPTSRWYWTRIPEEGVTGPDSAGWHAGEPDKFPDFRDSVAAALRQEL